MLKGFPISFAAIAALIASSILVYFTSRYFVSILLSIRHSSTSAQSITPSHIVAASG